MSRMAIGDRLRTIAVTAILTSVGWLAFGGSLMDSVGRLAVLRKTEAATGAGSLPNRVTDAPLQQTKGRPVRQAGGGEYVMPVAGVQPEQLTDTFTAARGGGARVHDAIDIMAPRGTPVLAAADGTVEKLFTSDLGGLTIYVRSPDRRTITYYAHLDGYAPGLAEKQQVARGQRIGIVGSTGNAGPSGPQLHFAIMQTTPQSKWWEPSVAVNPYPLLAGGRR